MLPSASYSTNDPTDLFRSPIKQRAVTTITTTNDQRRDENRDLNDASTCWVTVFGFPPGESQAVVRHFEGIVKVVDHHPKQVDRLSNWVHLKLQSPKQVAVALGQSGKLLTVNGDFNAMIGVVTFLEGEHLDLSGKPGEAPPLAKAAGQPPRRPSTLAEKAWTWLSDV